MSTRHRFASLVIVERYQRQFVIQPVQPRLDPRVSSMTGAPMPMRVGSPETRDRSADVFWLMRVELASTERLKR